jgi:hypothetical protein
MNIGVYRSTARSIAWTLVGTAFGLGLVFLLGDDERFSSPSFVRLMDVPGGKHLWGLAWLIGGVVLATVRLSPTSDKKLLALAISHFLGGVLALFFALFFLQAAIQDPHASLTGPVAYGALGWIYLTFAVANWTNWHLRKG